MVAEKTPDGWILKAGSGGLVSALAPVLAGRHGTWIGWPGGGGDAPHEQLFADSRRQLGFHIHPVALSREQVDGYYYGFSNETLWPLFHSLLDRTIFRRDFWRVYREANAAFARATVEATAEDDLVWIQDYHLLLAAEEIRKIRPKGRLAFFLHIPFPSPDIFVRLPWRQAIIDALLQYDLVGFQTLKDRRNFIQCVRLLVADAKVQRKNSLSRVILENREALAGAFPIGIDFHRYHGMAKSPEAEKAAWLIHEKFPRRKLIIGVDRLDYTKGIPHRLEAFEHFLNSFPDSREKITLVQVVVPSRTEVPEYQKMKKEIDELVGRINGRHTRPGWVPIHYVFGSLNPVELAAYYRTSEIALITPLNDGMNLVAKEYCAASVDYRGTLILSEFAGAAFQLKRSALLVNPYDIVRTAETINRAWKMADDERAGRMRRLRAIVRRTDVYQWVDNFLAAAETSD